MKNVYIHAIKQKHKKRKATALVRLRVSFENIKKTSTNTTVFLKDAKFCSRTTSGAEHFLSPSPFISEYIDVIVPIHAEKLPACKVHGPLVAAIMLSSLGIVPFYAQPGSWQSEKNRASGE